MLTIVGVNNHASEGGTQTNYPETKLGISFTPAQAMPQCELSMAKYFTILPPRHAENEEECIIPTLVNPRPPAS